MNVTFHPNEARPILPTEIGRLSFPHPAACAATLSRMAGEGSCWLFAPKFFSLPQDRYCTWVKCYLMRRSIGHEADPGCICFVRPVCSE